MAKGQKRSNREVKKPKATKTATAGSPAATPKGSLSPDTMPKKKG